MEEPSQIVAAAAETGAAPAEAIADAGAQPDKVDELQRLAEALKTSRATHKRELEAGLRAGQLSHERYRLGLKALGEVKPSPGKRLFGKLPEMAGDAFGSALLFVVAGVSIESLIAHSIISGADFISVYLFILPLTFASVAIVWAIARAQSILVMLLSAAAILFVAAKIQNGLTGRHLTIRPTLCPNPGSSGASSCSGLQAVANYIAAVASGYWHAFGPAAFIVAVTLGAVMGVMTSRGSK